ncbi:hypothetical protein NQ314_019670 [Rhamnusium bicolor]|uniref:ABC transporter F family member 4 n=1 Tax=Rhamnusium bicolor TaxID=1586634 RepID=A0AAV8WPY9_9CUCU|nr:hypothetical protein NQ314_019670 [Rhamnusium bicolor]
MKQQKKSKKPVKKEESPNDIEDGIIENSSNRSENKFARLLIDEENDSSEEQSIGDRKIEKLESKSKSPSVELTAEITEKFASTKISEETGEKGSEEIKEKKLTHKEKKKMKKQQEYEKQMETMLKKGGQGHSELDSNFTVSQAQKTAGQMAALENAVDIKIENFSISAKGNDLFINANLLIAQGRHYGLVGPNG